MKHHKRSETENADLVRNRVIEIIHWLMKADRKNFHSRVAFGKRINIPSSRIYDWENLRGYPSLEVLVDICREFSVAPDYLLLGKGPMFGHAEIIARIEALERRMDEAEKIASKN